MVRSNERQKKASINQIRWLLSRRAQADAFSWGDSFKMDRGPHAIAVIDLRLQGHREIEHMQRISKVPFTLTVDHISQSFLS